MVHMSHRIDSVANQTVDFEIPHAIHKDKYVHLQVPQLDCFERKDLEAIEKSAAENRVPADHTEFVRIMLHQLAVEVDAPKTETTRKRVAAAVDELKTRQLAQISTIWADESGMSVGESSA